MRSLDSIAVYRHYTYSMIYMGEQFLLVIGAFSSWLALLVRYVWIEMMTPSLGHCCTRSRRASIQKMNFTPHHGHLLTLLRLTLSLWPICGVSASYPVNFSSLKWTSRHSMWRKQSSPALLIRLLSSAEQQRRWAELGTLLTTGLSLNRFFTFQLCKYEFSD